MNVSILLGLGLCAFSCVKKIDDCPKMLTFVNIESNEDESK